MEHRANNNSSGEHRISYWVAPRCMFSSTEEVLRSGSGWRCWWTPWWIPHPGHWHRGCCSLGAQLGWKGPWFYFLFLSGSNNPVSWLKNISRQVCALRTGDSTPPDCLEERDWFHCCFQQGHYQTGFIWMVSFQLDCVAWLGCSASFVLQLSDWKRWEGKGKSILKYFFTARKITQNVDLCPQSATKSSFAILNLRTSQNVWDLSASWSDCCRIISLWTIQGLQTHAEGTTGAWRGCSPLSPWMFASLSPNCICAHSDRAPPPPR